MKISIDFEGTYNRYKEFFDAMANAMQKEGHKVGIIAGMRESRKDFILGQLGFKPDFIYLWGEFETIVNADGWKADKMKEEGVAVHFDVDARNMKLFTDLWVFKSYDPAQPRKF